MPTYDYKCDACGNEFERFHSITAQPIRKCPKCGKLKVRRLIGSGAGLIFRGSGFYITDYRSEAHKEAAKGDAGGAKTTEAKATSADSAPAAAESKPKKEAKSSRKTKDD